jgi:hypothetical protein
MQVETGVRAVACSDVRTSRHNVRTYLNRITSSTPLQALGPYSTAWEGEPAHGSATPSHALRRCSSKTISHIRFTPRYWVEEMIGWIQYFFVGKWSKRITSLYESGESGIVIQSGGSLTSRRYVRRSSYMPGSTVSEVMHSPHLTRHGPSYYN